jgi:hypothetical protein
MASRGRAPPCWTRWTRVSGARRAWLCLRTPAAGSRALRRRSGPPGIRGRPARGVWLLPQRMRLYGSSAGRSAASLCVVSTASHGRDQGAKPLCLCPPAGDTMERGPAGTSRLARAQAAGSIALHQPTLTLAVLPRGVRPGVPWCGAGAGGG